MFTSSIHPTDAQLDGLACIRCGRSFAEGQVASVPAWMGERGQLFACASHDRPQVGDTIHYRTPVMASISFAAAGATATETILRRGTVQAVHADRVLVGGDDAAEWHEVALTAVERRGGRALDLAQALERWD